MPTTSTRLQQTSEELVSEDVKEIISYRPHWMIRKGNLVFFAILLLLLALTLFIQYPDIINGSARLVSLNAPKTAIARQEGKLIALPVSVNQQVVKGQHLAFIETTASHEEVLNLYNWLSTIIIKAEGEKLESLFLSGYQLYHNLGTLQNSYQSFLQEWKEQEQFFGSGYYQKKKQALQTDLAFMNKLKATIQQQNTLTVQEKELQQLEYAAYDSLAKDKLVAPMELNVYKNKLIGSERSINQTASNLINNDIASHNKRKELLDLQKQVLDQQQKFTAALFRLKSETEAWMQQYIISSPEDGHVFFVSPLQINETVSAGQELFYIQPSSSTCYAQLMAGQNGFGKVKEGQEVKLKIESYPSEEYGYLKGVVSSVSNFPNRRDSFLVKVELLNGLKTSYGKEIFFRNNLLANAEIITDNRKLFERFFDPLKKIWKD